MPASSPFIPTSVDIVILGAGPAGIEATLAAVDAGYDAICLEAHEVGHSIERWSEVRLFSPWELDVSPRGRAHLEAAGRPIPTGDEPPTGREYLDRYLLPLAHLPELAPRVHTGVRAVGVGRRGLLKTDAIGKPDRRRPPFQILWERPETGEEGSTIAPTVIDATGVYETPSPAGSGGLWAPGERALGERVTRWIPTARQLDALAGRRVLIVGGGYSAATAVVALAERDDRGAITWCYRSESVPIAPIEADSLPERRALTERANRIAAAPPPDFFPRSGEVVTKFELAGEGPNAPIRVHLEDGTGESSTIEVDHVISLTGYRPDPTLLRECQVHHCWASDGLMKLSAQLLSTAGGGGDCLAVETDPSTALTNPEPGLFVIGSKSYGRFSQYLLRSGHQQVDALFGTLLPGLVAR